MKIYVDEMPKSCGDCVFCKQTEYCYYCDKLHTKLDYIDKDKDCPLQPLADYTKQVRKEVCEEIRNRFLATCQIEKGCDTASFSLEALNRILDQIEKGEI